ncbi:MAG TPA: cytochrome c peroxidase [Candidatus Angelobacter sp.]|jgi:cytochrome c peroxidase|nr:cytochrome c peroxidase [Candidatus Angelobacter sp.]
MARHEIVYRTGVGVALGAFLLFGLRGFSVDDNRPQPPAITPQMMDAMKVLPGGLAALPAVTIPADNPQTPAKIELGKKLFFDTRLSLDRSSSCATCHSPEKAFADGLPRARGFQGATLSRNSPTVLNAAYNSAQFWDGRAATLDEQCKGPLLAPAEMNMLDEKHLVDRLNSIPGYRHEFQSVFGSSPSLDGVTRAVAAYERTLVTPDSRFDHYAMGDKKALTDAEKRGLILFIGKAACSECHNGPNFTDNKYHNLGILPAHGSLDDVGRFAITKNSEDRNAFKTPTLRNVALTGPYMHDGSSATLEEVVELYDRGGDDAPNKSKLIYKLNLSSQEKADLVAFMKSLNGTLPQTKAPAMYPEADLHPKGELGPR